MDGPGLSVGSVSVGLGGDFDPEGFRRYKGEVDRARAEAKRGVKADLGAKLVPEGFRQYREEVARAKREKVEAKLSLDAAPAQAKLATLREELRLVEREIKTRKSFDFDTAVAEAKAEHLKHSINEIGKTEGLRQLRRDFADAGQDADLLASKLGGAGGGKGGGGGLAGAASSAESGISGMVRAAVLGAPAIVGLTGTLSSLIGSLGAATAGAGAVGGGIFGVLAVGLGSIGLAAVPAVTRLKEVAQAQKALTQAQGVAGQQGGRASPQSAAATQAVAAAQANLAAVTKVYGASSLQAAAATDRLHIAQAKQAAAGHGAAASSKQVTLAQEKLNAAVAKAGGKDALGLLQNAQKFGHAWVGATTRARGSIFGMAKDGIGALSSLLPVASRVANQSAGALRKALVPVWADMRKGEKGAIGRDTGQLGAGFRQTAPAGVDTLRATGTALLNIFAHAVPYVKEFTEYLDRGARRFLAWTESGDKLDRALATGVGHTRSWWHLLADVGKLMVTVFGGGARDGKSLVDSLDQIVKRTNAWLNTGAGQKSMRSFYRDSIDLTKVLLGTLGPLVAIFAQIARSLMPAMAAVAKSMAPQLKLVGQGFKLMGDSISWAVKNVPGFKELAAVLGTLFVAHKALRFAGALTGVTKLRDLYRGLRTAAEAATVAERKGAAVPMAQRIAAGLVALPGKATAAVKDFGRWLVLKFTGEGAAAGRAAGGAAAGTEGLASKGVMGKLKGVGGKLGGVLGGAMAFAIVAFAPQIIEKLGNALGLGKDFHHEAKRGWKAVVPGMEENAGPKHEMSAAQANAQARKARGWQTGGPVGHLFGPRGDRIPMLGEHGEYMVKRDTVRAAGLPFMEDFNRRGPAALRRTGTPGAPGPHAAPAAGGDRTLTGEVARTATSTKAIVSEFTKLRKGGQRETDDLHKGVTGRFKRTHEDTEKETRKQRTDVVEHYEQMRKDGLRKTDELRDKGIRAFKDLRLESGKETDRMHRDVDTKLGAAAAAAGKHGAKIDSTLTGHLQAASKNVRAAASSLASGAASSLGSLSGATGSAFGYIEGATNAILTGLKVGTVKFGVPKLPKVSAHKRGGPLLYGGGIIPGAAEFGRHDDMVLVDPSGRPRAAMAGDEGIVTRHQMPFIDRAMAVARAVGESPYGSLNDLWSGVTKTHSSGYRRGGRLPGFARGGALGVMGASTYGGPHDPSTPGDSGAYGHLRGTMGFAELGMGTLLGHLAPHTKLPISYGGKTIIGEKLDIGGGGGAVSGKPRGIDLWWQLARALGFPEPGTGLVTLGAPGSTKGATAAGGSGAVAHVKRATIAGVKPLAAAAQKAVDRTRNAANKYIDAHAPKATAAGATGMTSLPQGKLTPAQVKQLDGIVNVGWSGGPLAAWIAYLYRYAQSHGWDGAPGQISLSGFRTAYEQAHSGSVISSGSHHQLTKFPGGAIDIANPASRARFNAIIAASPYRGMIYNSGTAYGDPVHSSSGLSAGGSSFKRGGRLAAALARVAGFARGGRAAIARVGGGVPTFASGGAVGAYRRAHRRAAQRHRAPAGPGNVAGSPLPGAGYTGRGHVPGDLSSDLPEAAGLTPGDSSRGQGYLAGLGLGRVPGALVEGLGSSLPGMTDVDRDEREYKRLSDLYSRTERQLTVQHGGTLTSDDYGVLQGIRGQMIGVLQHEQATLQGTFRSGSAAYSARDRRAGAIEARARGRIRLVGDLRAKLKRDANKLAGTKAGRNKKLVRAADALAKRAADIQARRSKLNRRVGEARGKMRKRVDAAKAKVAEIKRRFDSQIRGVPKGRGHDARVRQLQQQRSSALAVQTREQRHAGDEYRKAVHGANSERRGVNRDSRTLARDISKERKRYGAKDFDQVWRFEQQRVKLGQQIADAEAEEQELTGAKGRVGKGGLLGGILGDETKIAEGLGPLIQVAAEIGGRIEDEQTTMQETAATQAGASGGGSATADAVAAAVTAFDANRADLFRTFGSNYVPAREAPGYFNQGGVQATAGAQFFGAGGSSRSGPETINIEQHYAAPPPDPHSYAQGLRAELKAVG